MFRSMKCKATILSMALCLVASQLAYSNIIIQENFDGAAGVDLGASANAPWITAFSRQNGGSDNGSASIFGADGSIDKVGPNGTHDAGALLALPGSGSLLANSVYTLSATITNNNSNWTAVGFASSTAQLDGVNGRHSNGNPGVFGGYAWGLVRNNAGNDQEIFGGAGTGSNFLGGDVVDPTAAIDFTVVLDTSDTSALTAEYFLNGASQGVQTLAASAFADIGFVGISSDGGNAADNPNASSISNFSLAVKTVPEPGSLSLLCLGGLAMLSRRRR